MRKFTLFLCILFLLGLITARTLYLKTEPVQTTAAVHHGYNILDPGLSLAPETAGSALLAEMNRYYLARTPTAKNECTGLLEGKNLILICADAWNPDPSDKDHSPALHRLQQEGATFTNVYRPNWYQGTDGQEFALLTGVIPTNVNSKTALIHTGEQNIFFPYSPARCFAQSGYSSLVFYTDEAHCPAYETLGFSLLVEATHSDLETAENSLTALLESMPFFAYYIWSETDGEPALAALMSGLASLGLEDDTVICLLTAGPQDQRAQIFLWGEGLRGLTATLPCSELDIVPTLLNLFGLDYDSRFLSGRDIFAPAGDADQASSLTPLVSLSGSAYSDWVTPAGNYLAGEQLFWQESRVLRDADSITSYVNSVNRLVYDRYVFARRVMENNYFQLVLSSQDCTTEKNGV